MLLDLHALKLHVGKEPFMSGAPAFSSLIKYIIPIRSIDQPPHDVKTLQSVVQTLNLKSDTHPLSAWLAHRERAAPIKVGPVLSADNNNDDVVHIVHRVPFPFSSGLASLAGDGRGTQSFVPSKRDRGLNK